MSNSDLKVLLVDDFGTIRTVLKLELSRLGFSNIEEAANGREALEKIKLAHAEAKPFSIIICDWNMPEMSGIELLELVRADDNFKKVPFVMVTAESEMNSVMRAIKAGATDYLVKPIAPDALSRKIQKIVETITSGKAA